MFTRRFPIYTTSHLLESDIDAWDHPRVPRSYPCVTAAPTSKVMIGFSMETSDSHGSLQTWTLKERGTSLALQRREKHWEGATCMMERYREQDQHSFCTCFVACRSLHYDFIQILLLLGEENDALKSAFNIEVEGKIF